MSHMQPRYQMQTAGYRPGHIGHKPQEGRLYGYNVALDREREQLAQDRIRVSCRVCAWQLDEGLKCRKCGEQHTLFTAKEAGMAEYWHQELIRLHRVMRETKKCSTSSEPLPS